MIEQTYWHLSSRRRWSRWLLGSLLVVLALTVAACDGGSDDNDSATPMATLNPGDPFIIGASETLTMSGVYLLPAGAVMIRTTCTGSVTVDIPTTPPQSNTCVGTGNPTIGNSVTGASDVSFTFAPGAFATVIVL